MPNGEIRARRSAGLTSGRRIASETAEAGALRRLTSVIIFMVGVLLAATLGYMAAGWSFGDALYMVLLTIYTVGYGEVRPVDTTWLRVVTMSTIVLGCTGMILVTGFLVQFLTASQVRRLIRGDRMQSDIDRLEDHVIICGFGRIGAMAARHLATGTTQFVVLDQSEGRLADARAAGFLAIQGDATDEDVLRAAGIERARVLATVLPSDAANVFITLSARSLNPHLQIIARGEAPSTESKLIQAGASQVVLPAHIGAERIADMILFPETTHFVHDSPQLREMETVLRRMGLGFDMAEVRAHTPLAGMTVGEVEKRASGALFVIQVERAGADPIIRPPKEYRLVAGDGLLVVGRDGGEINAALMGLA
ncbi:MAG TPA: NAD-binding protein [Caulobacteraceae bacterium]|jgi:voltage-gated potassium channel Kch